MRPVAKTFVTSESTHAAIPAGNRSYMTPVVNMTAHCECSPRWCASQLSAVAATPSATSVEFELRSGMEEDAGAHWHSPKVAHTSALQAAATGRRLCQTTHARQHTIASPSVICVEHTHTHK